MSVRTKISEKGFNCYPWTDGLLFQRNDSDQTLFFSTDGTRVSEISDKLFWQNVIGKLSSVILPAVDNNPGSVSVNSKGQVAVCNYEEGIVRIFGSDGKICSSFDPVEYNVPYPVYSLAWEGDNIWCASPSSHTLSLFSASGKLLTTIGKPFSEDGILASPEHVFFYDGVLYVCDTNNQTVMSLRNGVLNKHLDFDEPVWEWVFVSKLQKQCVVLDSGIYLI